MTPRLAVCLSPVEMTENLRKLHTFTTIQRYAPDHKTNDS